jgi:AraC-like DNA-binding protein
MAPLLRALDASYGDGFEIGGHSHGWGQLVYAASGMIRLTAAGQAWLIPPSRAVWLPPRAPHCLRMRGATRLRTIYIPPEHCGALPVAPLGLMVSPLLRELILELTRTGAVAADDAARRTIGMAMLVVLAGAGTLKLAVTLPVDRRARRMADAILESPGDTAPLEEIAALCGASLRTMQRVFMRETGMPVSEWRQVARLMAAAVRLLDGASVTDAALEAGYSGVSAFIHAFRLRLGQTPSRFRSGAAE